MLTCVQRPQSNMAFVESFSKILEMLKMFFKECKMNED
jgi:hypothetical protein